MALSKNKAVRAAYAAGEYTDARGVQWVRGMDGWFDYGNPDLICLARHDDMVNMIEQENPDE